MNVSWKMGSLMVWGLVLMEATAIFAAKECTNQDYKVNINERSVCCTPCTPSANSQVCIDADHRQEECRCSQGYGCSSRSCTTCKKFPNCKSTSQLKRTEKDNSVYEYYCEECKKGTYVQGENGILLPCEEQIFTTKSNRDGINSSMPSTKKTESERNTTSIIIGPSFNNWTSLVLCLALAVFIILLITITIHILLWKMKAAQLVKIAGDQFQPPLIIKNKEENDSWSCQYPEEEHGEEHGNIPVEKHYV